jgi:fluoroquinolone transport system ATP-binding protein
MTAFAITNLSYRYPKQKKQVLEQVSLTIQEGTIFGLLGPSGAGKSTTQKILTKLLPNYQGDVHYFGQSLKTLSKRYYEEIGVGFEMPVHFNKLTGLENMRFFASLYEQKIDYQSLMIRVGLGEALHQQVGQYSKGMKMRLNFVKALLNNPKVLFLDEPTNGLDPSNARIIKDIILEEKAKGKTILITTHLMNDVEELCDDVAFIVKGKVIETASPKSLKLKYGKRELKIEYVDQNELKVALFPLDQLHLNQQFQTIVEKHKIVTMHSLETSLDKIFIDITGENHG